MATELAPASGPKFAARDSKLPCGRGLAATRAFPGCIGVDVLVDTEDEAHLLLIEKWESIEHDQAYRDWRATDAGASALSTIVASRSLTRFVAA